MNLKVQGPLFLSIFLAFVRLSEMMEQYQQSSSRRTMAQSRQTAQKPKMANYRPAPKQMMGMSMDYLMGDDTDLMQYLQPIHIGKSCKGDCKYLAKEGDCKNSVKDDGCICTRDCTKYREPRICYYKFFLEQYSAMGPACRNCSGGNTSDCYQQQCVTGDGIERTAYTINRMMPGPTINVCYGDRIVIDCMNMMTSQSATIHWHGMLQQKSPWMDGAAFLSQCPIPPNGQFRYDFLAETEGTLWYHSHTGNLQRDGLNGALIVRTPKEMNPYHNAYDYDLPCHTINVADWNHFPFDTYFPGYFQNQTYIPIHPDDYLINGKGSYSDSVTTTITPHAQFEVKYGKKYRFRVIASSSAVCLFQFTIESHSMRVIALDGNYVKARTVKTLTMGSGERTDFILHANQKGKSSYYIAVKPLDGCANITSPQTAYLVYDDRRPIPTHTVNLTTLFRGPYLEFVEEGCSNNSNSICSYEFRSTEDADRRLIYGEPDYRFFLNAAGYLFNFQDLFENPVTPYQFFYEPVGGNPPIPGYGIFSDTISNISAMMPPVPLLTQEFPIPEDMICHNDCKSDYCSCINILEMKLNSYVEMVLTDDLGENHPFHIHGHQWVILYQGSAAERNRTNFWRNIIRPKNPVLRDVCIIPQNGYAVVRFKANNPGYWMFHCHFQNHLAGGMFLLLKVGERRDFVPPPPGFPTCEPYIPRARGVSKYSRGCSYGSNEARSMFSSAAAWNITSPRTSVTSTPWNKDMTNLFLSQRMTQA